MFIIAAIIGTIIGTIIFGIIMGTFVFVIRAENALNFFVGKWLTCCVVATVLIYGTLSDIESTLATIWPTIQGIIVTIEAIAAIVVLIGLILWVLSKLANKKENVEASKKAEMEAATEEQSVEIEEVAEDKETVHPEMGLPQQVSTTETGITEKLTSDIVPQKADTM